MLLRRNVAWRILVPDSDQQHVDNAINGPRSGAEE